MSYPDFAAFLRVPTFSEPGGASDSPLVDERGRHDRIEALEIEAATLKQAVVDAEELGDQWRQEAETAVKRVAELEAQVGTLTRALEQAELISDQHRQRADAATIQVRDLLAEVVDMTSELAEIGRGSNRRS
jgi:hypothetical protein